MIFFKTFQRTFLWYFVRDLPLYSEGRSVYAIFSYCTKKILLHSNNGQTFRFPNKVNKNLRILSLMEKIQYRNGFPYLLMIYLSTAEIPAQIRRHFQLPTVPRGVETGSLNTKYSGGSFRLTLQSANPAQRSCRTGPPVYTGWNRVQYILCSLAAVAGRYGPYGYSADLA